MRIPPRVSLARLPEPMQAAASQLIRLLWLLSRLLGAVVTSIFAPAWRGLNAFPQRRLKPWLTAFLIHPLTILASTVLWLALLLLGFWASFELVGGNYFNGASGLLGMLTLASVTHLHRKHDAHAASLADLHAKLDQLATAATAAPPLPRADPVPTAVKRTRTKAEAPSTTPA